jgi:hypothetical protein
MNRTRNGLTLTNTKIPGATDEWHTVDGKFGISRVRAITFCDGPHPMRYRDDRGCMVTTFHEGDEEHEYVAGWGIYDNGGHELTEGEFRTLNDAHDHLASLIAESK